MLDAYLQHLYLEGGILKIGLLELAVPERLRPKHRQIGTTQSTDTLAVGKELMCSMVNKASLIFY